MRPKAKTIPSRPDHRVGMNKRISYCKGFLLLSHDILLTILCKRIKPKCREIRRISSLGRDLFVSDFISSRPPDRLNTCGLGKARLSSGISAMSTQSDWSRDRLHAKVGQEDARCTVCVWWRSSSILCQLSMILVMTEALKEKYMCGQCQDGW